MNRRQLRMIVAAVAAQVKTFVSTLSTQISEIRSLADATAKSLADQRKLVEESIAGVRSETETRSKQLVSTFETARQAMDSSLKDLVASSEKTAQSASEGIEEAKQRMSEGLEQIRESFELRLKAIESRISETSTVPDVKVDVDTSELVNELASLKAGFDAACKTLAEQANSIEELSERVAGIKIPEGLSERERKEIVDLLLTKCDEICSHATSSIETSLDRAAKGIEVPKAPTIQELMPSIIEHIEKMHTTWALEFERRAGDRLAAQELRSQETINGLCRIIEQRAADTLAKFTQPKDGKDGIDAQNIRTSWVPESRTLIVLADIDGKEKTLGIHKLCVPQHVGSFDSKRKYEEAQIVTRNGRTWIAGCDEPLGLPGISTDWELMADAGRDGKVNETKEPPRVRVAPRKEG